MAYVKMLEVRSKTALRNLLNYLTQDHKTNMDLITNSNCSIAPENAIYDFLKLQNLKGRGDRTEIFARHIIQSFDPKDDLTYEKSHKLGEEYMKRLGYTDYQFYIVTHVDKNHKHNHIVFNPTNLVNGKQHRHNKKEYLRMQKVNDELCLDHGLHVIDNQKTPDMPPLSRYEWSQWRKIASYKLRMRTTIDQVALRAANYEDFIKLLGRYGYEVKENEYGLRYRKVGSRYWTNHDKLGSGFDKAMINTKISVANRYRTRLKNIVDTSLHNTVGWKNYATKENIKALNRAMYFVTKIKKDGYDPKDYYGYNLVELDKISFELKQLNQSKQQMNHALALQKTLNDNKALMYKYNQLSDPERTKFSKANPDMRCLLQVQKELDKYHQLFGVNDMYSLEMAAVSLDEKIARLKQNTMRIKEENQLFEDAKKVLAYNNLDLNLKTKNQKKAAYSGRFR